MKDKIPGQVEAFTYLRVAAVYLIFVSHTYLFNWEIFRLHIVSFFFSAPAWACIWVLFTLSGYLAGRSFRNGKYFHGGGVGYYYYRRMTKIWVPAIFFIILYSILCRPNFIPENPHVLWEYLFCTYRGTTTEFTAMWYAFTSMSLYFLTPLFVLLLKKLKLNAGRILACFVLLMGMSYRLYTYYSGLDYLRNVYYPLHGAIDLYFFGVTFGLNTQQRFRKRSYKIVSIAMLCGLFFIGFASVWLTYAWGKTWLYDTLYSYFGPTLFSVATVMFLVAYDEDQKPVSDSTIFKTVNWLGKYSFEFYMIHSYILGQISPFLQTQHPLSRHMLILSYTFMISISLAVMYHLWTSHITKTADSWLNAVLSSSTNAYWKKVVLLFLGMFLVIFAIYKTFSL